MKLRRYMGYSAMVMARKLRELGGGGRIQSCDVNALTFGFANELVALAGAGADHMGRHSRQLSWQGATKRR